MAKLEIASAIKDVNMYELASKSNARVVLDEEEKAIAAQVDEWAKEIGNTGNDKDHQIAAFVQRVITDQYENYPLPILDQIFDRGSVGEDEGVEYTRNPKNTLKAVEAAQGGNVERSFLDIEKLTPVIKNLQVETDLSYADLRRNGWKTISLLSEYAVEALNNKMFAQVFDTVDAAITSGAPNYIDGSSTTKPTQALMDQLSLYIHDWNEGGSIIALSKYIQNISKLSGYESYLSEDMKNQLWRTGDIGMYDGLLLQRVATYRYLNGDGVTPLIKDKRVFGVAGKIGNLDMIGDQHTYEVSDPNTETIHLLIKDFKYAYAFTDAAASKVAKIVLQ